MKQFILDLIHIIAEILRFYRKATPEQRAQLKADMSEAFTKAKDTRGDTSRIEDLLNNS
jgi:hypothetical protein